ncbi:hypothetical protein D3C78_881660 [compost metagenome]
MSPVEAFTAGGTRLLEGLEAAVVFQGLATAVAKTAEVGVQRVFALGEPVVQRLQHLLPGFGRRRPVDQWLVLQALEFVRQFGGVNGHAQRTFAEDLAGCGIQAIEEQPAGGRVGAIALRVVAEHRVYRADRQGLGAPFAGNPGEVLQGLCVADTTVARAS